LRCSLFWCWQRLRLPKRHSVTTPPPSRNSFKTRKKSGAKILVIESPNATSVTVNGGTGMRTMGKRFEADAFEFRQRFKNILGGAAGFTGETKRTLQRHNPAGGIGWVGIALLLAMVYLALG
jgi:hypothetical protein